MAIEISEENMMIARLWMERYMFLSEMRCRIADFGFTLESAAPELLRVHPELNDFIGALLGHFELLDEMKAGYREGQFDDGVYQHLLKNGIVADSHAWLDVILGSPE